MPRLHLAKAFSASGADMGRGDHVSEPSYPVRFRLQRVDLDSGGYDSGGAYWGRGEPLYRAWGDGNAEVQVLYTRAPTRGVAIYNVVERFPNATFFKGLNSTGQYYRGQSDGHVMLCNADGSRSIFDDVDE